jgi:hypothetical protein
LNGIDDNFKAIMEPIDHFPNAFKQISTFLIEYCNAGPLPGFGTAGHVPRHQVSVRITSSAKACLVRDPAADFLISTCQPAMFVKTSLSNHNNLVIPDSL